MKIVRKLLSVVLAISMIIGVVSVMASALAPDTAIDMYLASDKATYKQGDIITLTVSQQTIPEVGATYNGGVFVIFYDSNYFEPTTTSIEAADHNVVGIAPGFLVNDSTVGKYSGTMPTINNWNAAVQINAVDDSVDLDCTTRTDLVSIPLKVKADAPNGTTVLGYAEEAYIDYIAYSNDAANGGIQGYDDDYGFGTTYNYGFNNLTVTIGETAAASIIKDGGSQIRFRGISQTGTAADYQGEFDVRTVAKISEADFAAKFTDEATAIEKITDIGFVYARTSKVADFNLETAKQVAQGADIAGYTKKQISHIQHTAGNDYQFTCLVENIPDADKTDSLNALAYVCFDGEWIFADAKIFADFTELYGRMPQ